MMPSGSSRQRTVCKHKHLWPKPKFDSDNAAAAHIIAADPEHYPSLPMWAELILEGRNEMPTQFREGRYRVRILNQCFTASGQKGTLGFVLTFRVLCQLDQPESPVKPYQRDAILWVTHRTVKRVLDQLHQLGYEGADLSGVDPDTEGFHDFRDTEVVATCSHEPNGKGEVYEQWSLEVGKQNLKDKTLLCHFDRLLALEHEMATVGAEKTGITNDDVPF
jgi:hypothetical protein